VRRAACLVAAWLTFSAHAAAAGAAADDAETIRTRLASALRRFAGALQESYGHDSQPARMAVREMAAALSGWTAAQSSARADTGSADAEYTRVRQAVADGDENGVDRLLAAFAAGHADAGAVGAATGRGGPFGRRQLLLDSPGTGPLFVPAPYVEGLRHLRASRYEAALLAFTAALDRDVSPRAATLVDERAGVRQAERLLQDVDRARAEQVLKDVVAAVPHSGLAHYMLGRVYQSRQRPVESSLELLASVEALVDGAGTVLEAAAVLRLNDGDLAGAIVAYRRQLEVDPNNSAAHRRLGELYGQQGRLDAALGEFAAALLADPASADGHASRAQALLRLGRFGDAEAAARRAVALQPRHEAALYALGTALVRLDQHDEGARVLEQFEALRAVSRAREERDWQLARLKDEAGQRVDQGDYGGAAALLRQAAALAPDDPAILLAAGAVLVRSGQHEAAIPLLTRALALRETPEGRRYLSEARAAMGR